MVWLEISDIVPIISDENVVKKWAKDVLEDPNIDKVFHNAPYDVGWLRWWGINVKGKFPS